MGEFQIDEIVNVTVAGARIHREHGVGDDGLPLVTIVYGQHNTLLPLSVDNTVTFARVAPPEWPPQAGDIWGHDKSRWIAQRYHADFDNKDDYAGCNSDGWRIVLVPLDGGPYGDVEGRPEEVREIAGRLTLVHREKQGDSKAVGPKRPGRPLNPENMVAGSCQHCGQQIVRNMPGDRWRHPADDSYYCCGGEKTADLDPTSYTVPPAFTVSDIEVGVPYLDRIGREWRVAGGLLGTPVMRSHDGLTLPAPRVITEHGPLRQATHPLGGEQG